MAAQLKHRIPHPQYLGFAAVLGAAFAVLAGFRFDLPVAFVVAFDVAALTYIATSIGLWRSRTGNDAMAKRSMRDRRWRTPLLLTSAGLVVAVLVSIVALLHDRTHLGVPAELLAIVTEIITWTFANLIYAHHYARLYFDAGKASPTHGGLEMPGGRAPKFADFVNFAFVIGMTCQTADIEISSDLIRRVTTFHGIAAFFFNLGVLAITINIVAGAI